MVINFQTIDGAKAPIKADKPKRRSSVTETNAIARVENDLMTSSADTVERAATRPQKPVYQNEDELTYDASLKSNTALPEKDKSNLSEKAESDNQQEDGSTTDSTEKHIDVRV